MFIIQFTIIIIDYNSIFIESCFITSEIVFTDPKANILLWHEHQLSHSLTWKKLKLAMVSTMASWFAVLIIVSKLKAELAHE